MSQKLSVPLSRLFLECAESDPNAGAHDPSGGSNASGKRKPDANHGTSRKRADDEEEDPDRNGTEESDDLDNNSGDTKRAKMGECQRWPCPYRKRHPTRFNVRDYSQCVLNTFGNMALLNPCEVRTGKDDQEDPEEGLSAEKYECLAKRNKSEKVDTWDALWMLLFPGDATIPSPREQPHLYQTITELRSHTCVTDTTNVQIMKGQ
ncbi:hypothetical protein Daus18300_010586 [Diaporthe australafricana]|uniref:Uncharacterized protein n=1 Tax=Diaporthe australafricana TaxID=127596 RepID=A0ABR3W9T7_9PEZI